MAKKKAKQSTHTLEPELTELIEECRNLAYARTRNLARLENLVVAFDKKVLKAKEQTNHKSLQEPDSPQ